MSPEKAKVFVAEDDESWQEIIKLVLEQAGHEVVLSATSRTEALEAVNRFQELGIQVATIDGNLNEYDSDGADGRAVLFEIKTSHPEVKTVGMGGFPVRGATVEIGKMGISKLGEAVTNL